MRFLILLVVLGCRSAGPHADDPALKNLIPSGSYVLHANGPAAAGGPVRLFELGTDGTVRVTEGGVLHVRTHLVQSGGGNLEFLDQEGPRACRNPDPIPGRYRVERTAKGWQFHVLSDACEGRRGALDGTTIAIAGS